jgi:hypothetical protein
LHSKIPGLVTCAFAADHACPVALQKANQGSPMTGAVLQCGDSNPIQPTIAVKLACEPAGAKKKRDRTKQMKPSYELLLTCRPCRE